MYSLIGSFIVPFLFPIICLILYYQYPFTPSSPSSVSSLSLSSSSSISISTPIGVYFSVLYIIYIFLTCFLLPSATRWMYTFTHLLQIGYKNRVPADWELEIRKGHRQVCV